MSVMEMTPATAVIFSEEQDLANAAYLDAREAVVALNIHSVQPDFESLTAFIDLLYMTDQQYIEVPEAAVVAAQPEAEDEPVLDWDSVLYALEESQKILMMVQEMLSATLADMNIADHDAIRFFADDHGWLRVVGEHDRKMEIESVVNSAENNQLREYYMSATAGMTMAGSLVGTMAVPPEVVESARARQYAAAS